MPPRERQWVVRRSDPAQTVPRLNAAIEVLPDCAEGRREKFRRAAIPDHIRRAGLSIDPFTVQVGPSSLDMIAFYSSGCSAARASGYLLMEH